MNNIYFYTWYVLYRFFKKNNRTGVNSSFAAVCFLSLLMSINLLPIVIYSGGLIYHEAIAMVYVKSFFVLIPVVAINYFFIMRNRKSDEVEIFFDGQRDLNQKNGGLVLLAWVYIIGSLAMGWYLSQHIGKTVQ